MGEGKKLLYDAETKKMCKQAITGSKDWKDKEEKILQAFKTWDKDGNGFITKDELADVLSSLGCPTKSEDLDVMLKEADLDLDGKINYEEMTHWLCRAPHLEQYFLRSVHIFKQNFIDSSTEMNKIMLEMLDLKKEMEAMQGGAEGELESLDGMKKGLEIMRKVAERFQEVVKKNQTRMNDELPPVILQSFKYHDKDESGTLTYDESIIFFSNFMALWEPFAETMSELNAIFKEMDCDLNDMGDDTTKEKLEEDMKTRDEKLKLVTPDKLHEVFKQKYAILKEERAKNIDEYHVKAFEVLSVDGKIEEGTLKEALLHGTDKNSEFLRAMNLEVSEVMKETTEKCKEFESQKDELEEAMQMMESMMGAMAALGAMGAALEGMGGGIPGGKEGDLGELEMGECNMQ